jgi:hypothetical protein
MFVGRFEFEMADPDEVVVPYVTTHRLECTKRSRRTLTL